MLRTGTQGGARPSHPSTRVAWGQKLLEGPGAAPDVAFAAVILSCVQWASATILEGSEVLTPFAQTSPERGRQPGSYHGHFCKGKEGEGKLRRARAF